MWKVSVLYLPYLVSTAKKLQVDHDRRFENYITSHRLSLPSGPSMSGQQENPEPLPVKDPTLNECFLEVCGA